MAILSTGNLLSEQRYDISDARRVESAVRNDFDTTVTSIFTGTSQGYIIRGFSIITSGAIGSAANGLQMIVDPGAVLHIDASVSGTIFQTPIGTVNQVLNAATNTNVSGSFAANSTNYVGIDYVRFADPTTDVTKYIWNASANDEIQTIAPAAQTLTFEIVITTSVWALNVLPVAIVTTDSNGNVLSITDARWLLFSLGTGGLNPNPNYVYPWSQGTNQSPVTTTSDSINPFIGGDKQLSDQKDWMNAIMSEILAIKGTPYWFTGPNSSPAVIVPSLQSLFQDLGNTVITGSGEISSGILPNSDNILAETGSVTAGSNQLTSLSSVTGLSAGDYIFGTGIQAGTTILSISGSGPYTVTMSLNATIGLPTVITVTFYSPSVITSPGQINWDQPIFIDVIGSSLSYELAANPSSTDITLANDEVAYITLVREQAIIPNLIFTGGSPTVTSVGNVVWTTGLVAGDYIKLASDTSSGYYEILSVAGNGYQVTLTTNVSIGDNTGSGGAKAQYAFGSYLAAPSPSTNRNIYITSRETVPIGGNTFWLFMREDNGGNPRVYIRFLAEELNNGESVQVSGTTSQQLLEYVGSLSPADSSPQYVSALNPGSLPETTLITVGAESTMASNEYFLINSSGNARQYAVWVNANSGGMQPVVPYVTNYIQWPVTTGQTSSQTATALALALNSTPNGDFSAVAGSGTVTVTNTSSGVTNAAVNFNVGAPFAVSISQAGTGVGNYAVHDGDNLTLAIKELDQSILNIANLLDSPSYDETVDIVSSGATPPTSLNGPIVTGTDITLPNNSREGNVAQYYTVGKGALEIFLNGQFLSLNNDWTEVGATGAPSQTIQIQQGLVVGDVLEFRISATGGPGGSGNGSEGPPGPAGPPGENAAGGPVAISTKTSNYNVLLTDCFLAADCTGGAITFTLPTAASATGKIFYLKKIDSSLNAMTIQGNGAELIDGFNTQITNTQYESFSIISTGTQWWIF